MTETQTEESVKLDLDRIIIYKMIDKERARQDRIHGFRDLPMSYAIPDQFFKNHADIAKQLCDRATEENRLSWWEVLREEMLEVFAADTADEAKKELVHVAAVAVKMIECIERNGLVKGGNPW